MATVQTLNDKDGNTFYPVTKTEAVYNADGTKTLDYILDNTIIASKNPADANKVFKGDASLGLVGPDNIDMASLISVLTNNGNQFAKRNWMVNTGDANEWVNFGTYSCYAGTQNLPTGATYASILTLNYSDDRGCQICVAIGNTDNDPTITLWFRGFYHTYPGGGAPTWKSWKKIIDQ